MVKRGGVRNGQGGCPPVSSLPTHVDRREVADPFAPVLASVLAQADRAQQPRRLLVTLFERPRSGMNETTITAD